MRSNSQLSQPNFLRFLKKTHILADEPAGVFIRFGDFCSHGLHWTDAGRCADHDLVEKVVGLLKAITISDISHYIQHQPQLSAQEKVRFVY